jgi:hypothetical protein
MTVGIAGLAVAPVRVVAAESKVTSAVLEVKVAVMAFASGGRRSDGDRSLGDCSCGEGVGSCGTGCCINGDGGGSER